MQEVNGSTPLSSTTTKPCQSRLLYFLGVLLLDLAGPLLERIFVEDGVYVVRGIALHGGNQVRIDVESEPDTCMPETFRDDLSDAIVASVDVSSEVVVK
jgi:hypothetical protein